MNVKRFNYFYKQRKLPISNISEEKTRISYLLPEIERKTAGVTKRGFFTKVNNRLQTTRAGNFYIASLKRILNKTFRLSANEQLKIKSNYPNNTFPKRASLFEKLGVINDVKKGHILPPTTEEIHLEHLLKTGNDRVWSICNLFRKTKRPSWAFAEGFPRFDLTWITNNDLNHVFPMAKKLINSLGFKDQDIGIMMTIQGKEKFKRINEVSNKEIKDATRIHFLIKSKYSDQHIGTENYLSLLDLSKGRTNDFVNDSKPKSFISLGISINRIHLLQIEKRIKSRPFDLVILIPESQSKKIQSSQKFFSIKKKNPHLLVIELKDSDFSKSKIGKLNKYAHEAITEYSNRALIFGPKEQSAKNLEDHIFKV